MDYIDKQIYLALKEIVFEYSIIQNEFMRHSREYPQVIHFNELNNRFIEEYPEIFDNMIDYHGNLHRFLMGVVDGVYINEIYNLVWTYEKYQRRLSLKLPLNCILVDPNELLLIIVPKHRVKEVPDDNTDSKSHFIDCRLGNFTKRSFSVEETKAYCQKYEKLQKYYNMTREKYDSDITQAKRKGLSESLYDYYKKLLPHENILQRQTDLIAKLNKMLEGIWPEKGYKIVPFGSTVTNLMLQGSDIDLCIVLPDDKGLIKEYVQNSKKKPWGSVFNVEFIASQLKMRGMEKVEAIHALVPICKFQDPVTKLSCDLSIHNTLAIENSKLIRTYIRLDDRIRPLLYLIKSFTKKRQINKSISGTLSSYSYVLLCLAYLRKARPSAIVPNLQALPIRCESPTCLYHEVKANGKKRFLYRGEIRTYDTAYHTCIEIKNDIRDILKAHDNPTSTLLSSFSTATTSTSSSSSSTTSSNKRFVTVWESYNSTDLATLLIEFFDFYSSFNFDQFIVAPAESGFIPRDRSNKGKKEPIIIKDPFIRSRNVAATCTEIGLEVIQQEFRRAYNMLTNGATFKDVCSKPNLQKRPYDPDSVENRKGYRPKSNNNNSSNGEFNGTRMNDLSNVANIHSKNYYQNDNDYNNNNVMFVGYNEVFNSATANFLNEDYDDDDDDDNNIHFVGYNEVIDSAITNFNNILNTNGNDINNNDDDNVDDDDSLARILLKSVPEYTEEEDIIDAFNEYGLIVEMSKWDTTVKKNSKSYCDYYNWNITLNTFGLLPALLPNFISINGDAIYFDILG